MERVNEKIADYLDALQTLQESVDLFYEYKDLFEKNPTKKNESLFTSMRDSMIQRFEYCTDLFWKVLKLYLEETEKIDVPINSPRAIVREAVTARILNEVECSEYMSMVESRNRTSHIYHEAIADKIAHEVPSYYEFMHKMIQRIQTIIAKNKL
jgi:nucleotidyltransferase substrate binding protein (TIGR01987 family)